VSLDVVTGLRAALIACALVLWFLTHGFSPGRAPGAGGMSDRVHAWTAPLHARLAAHPRVADAVLIASSAVIDVFGLWLLGSALLGPTFARFSRCSGSISCDRSARRSARCRRRPA